jgi:hypothetical protein
VVVRAFHSTVRVVGCIHSFPGLFRARHGWMFSLCGEAVRVEREVVCGVESLRPASGRTKSRLTNELTGNRRCGDDRETLTLSWKRSRLDETSKREQTEK